MPIKDPERVTALLSLVEKVANVSPGFSHITADAMAELREINEGLRKFKESEQNRPVTPAAIGDPESPAQPTLSGQENDGVLVKHPLASTPVKAEVAVDTPPPPVTQPELPSTTPGRTRRNTYDGLPGPAEGESE